jgi:hypothetical protein
MSTVRALKRYRDNLADGTPACLRFSLLNLLIYSLLAPPLGRLFGPAFGGISVPPKLSLCSYRRHEPMSLTRPTQALRTGGGVVGPRAHQRVRTFLARTLCVVWSLNPPV